MNPFKEDEVEYHDEYVLLSAEKEAFTRLAQGEGITAALNVLLTAIEQLAGQHLYTAVWLIEGEPARVSFCAGPRIPAAYWESVQGSTLGPDTDSCGQAIYNRQSVAVPDVTNTELWATNRDLLVNLGFRASWSTPIVSSLGSVLGSFAVYYPESQLPRPDDRKRVARVAQTTTFLIERHRADEDRKNAEAALRESQERFKAFMASVPANCFIKDSDGRYLFVNRSVERLMGRAIEQWIGKTDHDLFPRKIADQFVSNDQAMLRSRTLQSFEEHVRDNRAERDMLSFKFPIPNGGEVLIGGIAVDITDSKRTAKRLAEQARLLNLSRDAIIVRDHDGCIQYWNHGATELYGWTAEEATGQIIHDLLGTTFPEPLQAIAAVLQRDGTWSGELRHIRKDGACLITFSRWVLDHDAQGKPVAVLETNTDVTARKSAEEALQSANREAQAQAERLRLAMAAANMGAWDWDLRTGAVVCNARQYEMFGVTNNPPQNVEAFFDLLHPDDVAPIRRATSASILNGQLAEDFRVVRPDGVMRWLTSRGTTTYDNACSPVRMVGVTYDITEQKQLQDKLQSFAKELEREVADRTKKLVASKERLRALATELSLAEQRERKRLAIELHDHLQQLLALCKLKLGQGRRIAEALPACRQVIEEADDVLSEALQYTHTLVAELSPPVLREHGLIAGLQWLADYMRKHDLTVSVETPEEDALHIPEDQAVLLFQSVRELLMNVSKHAETNRATIALEERDGTLRIEVRDQGKGFETEAHTRDLPNSLTSRFGLLSIDERMRAIGGSFHVSSALGKGTTATLVLSGTYQNTTEVASSTGSTGRSPKGNEGQDHRIRVLLADDHAMMRQGLRRLLEGYPAVEIIGEAKDGVEVLAMVKELRPSVVIMDITMPRINGIEATARLRSQYPDVCVIGLSVNAGNRHVEAMTKVGASGLVAKEKAVEDLYAMIQEAVRGKASSSPS